MNLHLNCCTADQLSAPSASGPLNSPTPTGGPIPRLTIGRPATA